MPTSPAEQMREACARVAEKVENAILDLAAESGATEMRAACHMCAESIAAAIRTLPAPDEWQGIDCWQNVSPETVARVIAEAHLWPGAWEKMSEPERDHARHIRDCVARLFAPAAPSPEGSGDA